jgi:hypothetical protein
MAQPFALVAPRENPTTPGAAVLRARRETVCSCAAHARLKRRESAAAVKMRPAATDVDAREMADHNKANSHPEQGMIKPWQASKIFGTVQPSAVYLFRLRERMEKAGLKREKLYGHVCQAHNAMNELCLELHHLAAGGADMFRGALK